MTLGRRLAFWSELGIDLVILIKPVTCFSASQGHKFYETRQFDRSEWCVMGPGVVLAVIGMCLFAFAETHDNYPVIHSSWHVCMALCVVFLLPKRKTSDSSKGMWSGRVHNLKQDYMIHHQAAILFCCRVKVITTCLAHFFVTCYSSII